VVIALLDLQKYGGFIGEYLARFVATDAQFAAKLEAIVVFPVAAQVG